jgi:ABC-type antimicrobial peptide transport system permease subunit
MSVIGVVGDVRFPGAQSTASTMQIYSPFEADFRGGSLLMRVDENAADVLARVTGVVHAIDPRWKVRELETMDASIARLLTGPKFSAALLGLFAGVAALLTIVGLYGVVAYAVAQRTREMGIRMALGATSRDVWMLVVTHGARLAVVGIALGLALAFAATRLLRAQLHGVSPVDPATFMGIAIMLGAVTLLASYVPARRATRVDPMVAVRAE